MSQLPLIFLIVVILQKHLLVVVATIASRQILALALVVVALVMNVFP